MEKVLKKMPGAGDAPRANIALEINLSHPIANKLKELWDSDKDAVSKYAKALYSTACLLSGVNIENPAEFAEIITDLMLK